MIRMLIVDDEVRIANAVYNFFLNQKDLELELYRAYSAEEAVRLFAEAKFDLLLSDICMPGMDGLELLGRVKAEWPNCRVIFLTGYDNFEYAYNALRYDGVSYLLKSEGYDALGQRVREQIDALNRERALRIAQARSGPARTGTLSGLLSSREGQYALLMACPPGASAASAGILPALAPFAPVADAQDGDLYVALFRTDVDPDAAIRLSETLEDMQRDMCEALGMPVALALSGAVDGRTELSARYAWLRARLFSAMESNPSVLLQELESALTPGAAEPARHSWERAAENSGGKASPLERLALLEQALARHDWQQARSLLETLSLRDAQPMELCELICRTNGALLRTAREMAWQPTKDEFFALRAMTILPSQDAHLMPSCWKSWLDTLCMRTHRGLDPAVEQTIATIRRELAGDLSLVRLSREVHYHPSYFSRLFKSETGENLTEFVLRLRIEEAKRLLGEHKVTDVAAKVGFTSARYFSRVFKEKTGVNPQDWK